MAPPQIEQLSREDGALCDFGNGRHSSIRACHIKRSATNRVVTIPGRGASIINDMNEVITSGQTRHAQTYLCCCTPFRACL